jgi:hypothetical protein
MINLRPEIEKVLAKHEKDFMLNEDIAERFSDEDGVRLVQELRQEFWQIRAHLVENTEETIGKDEAEDLKGLIDSKLAVGAKMAAEGDWWWKPARPATERVLQDVERVLRKTLKERWWRAALRYLWRVFVEIIYLILVIGAFSVTSTKFEIVVVGILVLIYNAASVGAGLTSFTFCYFVAGMHKVYGDIGRSLRLRIPIAPEKDAEKTLNTASVNMMIHNLSLGIGSFVAFWKLVNAVFF